MIGAVRSFLFNISFYSFTIISASIAVFTSLLLGTRAMRAMFWLWCNGTMFLVRWVLGAKVEIRGREHIGPETALLVAKHQSEMDIAIMGTVFPNYGAIAMQELDNYPLVGRIVAQLGHIKVKVEGPRQNQLPDVLEGAKRVHDEGRPTLIYPEGTLMRPGKKMRYRAGAWHIYNELGVAAVPVAKSLSLAWPRRDWRKFPVRCAMEFLEPIPPGLGKQEFMQILEDRIETGSNALIREFASAEQLETITFDYETDGGSWSTNGMRDVIAKEPISE
jgi:1-acyl-sn-glycerol-3-phosphate acyltransferase